MNSKLFSVVLFFLSIASFSLAFGSFNSRTSVPVAAFTCAQDFGNSCVDTDGKPRCKSAYTESCGSGCSRKVTCGGNGEFRTGACECASNDQPQCPVATIWDGSKCKGTAKGTNDETKDQDPVKDGGDKVADKPKKPKDSKTREEGNKQTDSPKSNGGGGTNGGNTDNQTTDTNEANNDPFADTPLIAERLAYLDQYGGSNINLPELVGNSDFCGQGFEVVPAIRDTNSGDGTVDCKNLSTGQSFQLAFCTNGKCHLLTDEAETELKGSSGQTEGMEIDIPIEPIASASSKIQTCYNTYNCATPNFNCPGTNMQTKKGSLNSSTGTFKCSAQFLYGVGAPEESITDFSTYEQIDCSTGVAVKTDVQLVCPVLEGSSGVFKIVSAQQSAPTPVLIDINKLNTGIYDLVVDGFESTEISIYKKKVSLKIFSDINGDGKKQADEPYIEKSEQSITISKKSELFSSDFDKGWNLVTPSFINSEVDSAKEFMEELWKQQVFGVQISKYSNGTWIHYIARFDEEGEVVEYGNDFTLVPGEAYFVRTLEGGLFILKGNAFTSSVPVNLSPGWNLIGVQSPNTDHTAKSFIEGCENQGALCTTISRYLNSRYDSYVKDEGTFFGNDFELNNSEGYFVLNNGESKTITP